MISFDIIKTAIRTGVLVAGTNTQVIFYFPNAVRPALNYTAIEFLTWGRIVNDWFETDTTTGAQKQFGFRELIVRLHFFGPNSYGESQTVVGKLESQTVRDAMRAVTSISLLESGGVDLTSMLIENNYETRAIVDLTFLVNIQDGSSQDNLGYFDQVEPIEWTNKPTGAV